MRLAALSLAMAGSLAVARPASPPATIRVTGQAQVSEAPDRVYIDIGVTTQEASPEAAASRDAARLSAVIAAVRRVAGAAVQLTTTEYSITPVYHYPREGAPTVAGYTASNIVRVRLDDLRSAGRVLEAATQEGSNTIQNMRFALRDDQAPRSEALREAALKARGDAEALAGALGLKIVRVLSVEEISPVVAPQPPFPQMRRLATVEAQPPIESGTIKVSASVTLTVEVAPAAR